MPRQDTKLARLACRAWLPVTCMVVVGLLAPQACGAAPLDTGPLQRMSAAFEALTNRVSPAVVEILVNGYGPDDPESGNPDAPVGRASSQGSGVIVDPDGYIVTNYHVIAGEQQVEVVITPRKSHEPQARAILSRRPRILPAKVVGYSKLADLAVLKVEATGLPTIQFAKYQRLRQGQLVLAVGSPQGLQNSVSLGLVSSVLRHDDPESPMVYIQTDAAINPGNSGGALVDAGGNLVGINTSILTQSGGNEGIGFAIPSGIVEFVYHQIRRYGHVRNGSIGASVQAITPQLAAGLALPKASVNGVIVSDVLPNSPAEKAGLRIYDRIQSIDGAPVDGVPTFTMDIYLRKDGSHVQLGVLRGDKKLSITVPVKEIEPGPTSLADIGDPATGMVPELGIVGVDLNAQSADFLPPPRIDSGVVVTNTTTDQRAEDIGLEQGDIIHALNNNPVTNLDNLRSALASLQPGSPAVLQVERAGRLLFVAFDID